MTKTYGPYSTHGVAGSLIFTAGQVGAVDGKAPAGLTGQTQLALKNLGDVLQSAGTSLADVVKVTVFLTDAIDFDGMNEIYAKIFEDAGCKPARSTVIVKELPRVADKPLLIEVEAVAYKKVS